MEKGRKVKAKNEIVNSREPKHCEQPSFKQSQKHLFVFLVNEI